MTRTGGHEPDPAVSVVRAPRQTRHQLVHRLDGRYGPLDPSEVASFAERLVARLDLAAFDRILGIPEGGNVPAFAVALRAGKPLSLATRTTVDLPVVAFREPHVPYIEALRFYGLEPGTSVVIVEDEITTGRTIVNAVAALRAAGIEVAAVATFFLVDHPATLARLDAAAIHVEAAVRIGARYLDRVEADDV